MSLWCDRHRPGALGELDLHRDVCDRLRLLASSPGDLPHLLFCGPPGSGKRTLIGALVNEIFGAGTTDRMKADLRPLETPSGKRLELQVLSSSHHIELNPSDVGIYDRVVVQEMLRDAAQTQPVAGAGAAVGYKILVVSEAESLTRDAQHALRRTMERFMRNMRIVFSCSNPARLIAPLRSRCLVVRVASPSAAQLGGLLCGVAQREGWQLDAGSELVAGIVGASGGNVRRALLSLECARVRASEGPAAPCDWEDSVAEVVGQMLSKQSTGSLLQIRTKLYELTSRCVPASLLIRAIALRVLPRLDQQLKEAVASDAAEYECRLVQGQKAVFHLEAFIARFMSRHRSFMSEMLLE